MAMAKAKAPVRLPEISKVRALRILERILTPPTAPYHEHRTRAAITAVLDGAGVSWALDRAGNVLARYRRGKARPVSFLAHMDHPGCEILAVEHGSAEARWDGQVPTFDLRDVRLAVWSPDGRFRGRARVLRGDGRPKDGRIEKGLSLKVPPGTRPGDFAHADLVPFRRAGGRIVSKALDNVAGCAAIVSALDHLARRKLPGDVTALFTRAEEVGFHGTLASVRLGTLSPKRPIVVLECSKAMPGAERGLGPVIRVGDRMRVFDPDLVAACEEAARALQRQRRDFRYQRRLMDGGVCEATAFSVAGFRSVCLAFPLGNYHNVGPKGIAPEFIAEADFLNGVEALAAFAALGLDPAGARGRQASWATARFGGVEMARLAATR